MKKENLLVLVAFFMLSLPYTSWAQVAQCDNDSFMRALRLELQGSAPLTAQPAKSFSTGGDKASCTATANCGSASPVSCSGSGTCTAVDRSCQTQRGYVQCDSIRTYCPPCSKPPLDPDPCAIYNTGSCTYTWDPVLEACLAPGCPPYYF